MQTETSDSLKDMSDALRTVAVNSAYNASRALSKWLKRGVRLTCEGFESIPISQISTVAPEADLPVVAVHMALMGDLSGDLLLIFPEPVAMQLADLMIGGPVGTTQSLGELEASSLQETGNIVGSAFTNCLSNWLRLSAIPNTPTVVHDMASAVIDPVLVSQAVGGDNVLVSKTEFEIDGQRLEWSLLLIPSADSLEAIKRRCDNDQIQKNALHTIAVNGAFAASRAMSKWLKRGVRLTTDGFVRVPLRELTSDEDDSEPVVSLHMHMADDLHGHALMVVPMRTALRFAEILMNQAEDSIATLDEMACSCLQETGNIVSGAFVNSWAHWLDMSSEPRPPQMHIDLLSAILQSVLVDQALVSDEAFMAKVSFSVDGRWLDWDFYLLPNPASLRLIEAAME